MWDVVWHVDGQCAAVQHAQHGLGAVLDAAKRDLDNGVVQGELAQHDGATADDHALVDDVDAGFPGGLGGQLGDGGANILCVPVYYLVISVLYHDRSR